MRVRMQIPPIYREVLIQKRAPLKVFWSGRAGGKSYSFATALLYMGNLEPLRIVCGRQFQASIADSVKELLDDRITYYGLDNFYKSQQYDIYGANGTHISFVGLDRHIQSIKSMPNIDIFWVEEGQSLKKEAIQILLPTVRKKGSEVWVSMNPNLREDPAYEAFILYPEPGSIVVRTCYDENPLVDDKSLLQAAWCQKVDPIGYKNIWLGEPKDSSEFLVFSNYKQQKIEPERLKIADGPYYGLDFGHTIDPCALVEVYINESRREIYITREAYKHNVEADDLPAFVQQLDILYDKYIVADSAGHVEITTLNNKGGHVLKAKKGPGSVMEGIKYIKNFTVFIDPECTNAWYEFTHYKWQVDKQSGLPKLKDPEDTNNHIIDAIRYALERVRFRSFVV